MSVSTGSRKKASGIGVCLLPAEGGKISKEMKQEQADLASVLGCSLESELKKRAISRKDGEVHTIAFSGNSKLLGVVVGFQSKPPKAEHNCSGSNAYNDPHRKLVRALGVSAQKASSQWTANSLFVCSSVFSQINDAEGDAALFWESLLLCQYEFSTYKSSTAKKKANVSLKVVFDDSSPLKLAPVKQISHIVDGINLARDLVNIPAGDLAPRHLATAARKIASNSKVQAKVLNRPQLVQKKMNGILSVGRASKEAPAFITLQHNPGKKVSKSAPVIGLVGKGITFDSGGLSIKTGSGMETMKCDMSGAAAVLGTFKALTKLSIPLHVKGYIAAAENMIDGSALRPGDVIKMMSGKTVEVLNTDAEGRLVLADALHYASNDGCDILIDLATLTGASVVALGEKYAALFANDEPLKWNLLKAAGTAGEGYWPMPLVDDYNEHIKSNIADIKNIGSRWGGAITAGLFLQNFVGDVAWAHMDIAGPAFTSAASGTTPKGGTGFGVRTLINYLQDLAK